MGGDGDGALGADDAVFAVFGVSLALARLGEVGGKALGRRGLLTSAVAGLAVDGLVVAHLVEALLARRASAFVARVTLATELRLGVARTTD